VISSKTDEMMEGGAAVVPPPVVVPHCETKMRYSNRKDAARARTRLRKRIFDRTGVMQPLDLYHCLIHHCFHLGHSPGWYAPIQKKQGR
jgi:hypothetical protein